MSSGKGKAATGKGGSSKGSTSKGGAKSPGPGQSSLFSFFSKSPPPGANGTPSPKPSQVAGGTKKPAVLSPVAGSETGNNQKVAKTSPSATSSTSKSSSKSVEKPQQAKTPAPPSTVKKPAPKAAKAKADDEDEMEFGSESGEESAYSNDGDGNEEEEEEEDDTGLVDSSDDEGISAATPKGKRKKAGGSGSTSQKRLRKNDYSITETKTPSNAVKALPKSGPKATPAARKAATSSASSTPHSSNLFGAGATPDSGATSMDCDTPPPPIVELPEGVIGTGGHKHHKWSWLTTDRKDANGRRPDHPDYNPRTLFVPPQAKKEETPAMQQWWDIKSKNMDTVLFFKVGKFYELFHMDADVGMQELDLIYMKGDKAHSGFPEISYGKFSDALVEKGYRIARVEQTETPEMMKERNSSISKGKSKVVNRELCSVLSRGTRTFCFLDLSRSESAAGQSSPALILAIVEKVLTKDGSAMDVEIDENAPPPAVCEYGVCMVDAATATFTLGQFADSEERPRLRTLLTQLTPAEVIMERKGLSEKSVGLRKMLAPLAMVTELRPKEEFWGAQTTLKEITKGNYFTSSDDKKDAEQGSMANWPAVLKAAVEGGEDGALCVAALGGALWHLKRSLIDHDLVSMGRFNAYVPPDDMSEEGFTAKVAAVKSGEGSSLRRSGQDHMILDGVALENLEILRNSFDGGEKGSLWAHMNRCGSAFGRRLLHDWLCKPLLSVDSINMRLDAVDQLMDSLAPEAIELRKILSKLPDIERLLSRVHSMGSLHRATEHPESRAVMYENDKYGARKVLDFIECMEGLEKACRVPEIASQGEEITSVLLKRCLLHEDSGGQFPEIAGQIKWFHTIFDAKKAKSDKWIKPKEGVHPHYDETKQKIVDIKEELQAHLSQVKKELRCSTIVYHHAAKEAYQLECPESLKVPESKYELISKKKGCRRFWTDFIREKVQELAECDSELDKVEKDQMRSIFARFDEHRDLWVSAVSCLSLLDALLALAAVSSEQDCCRPVFKEPGADVEPFLRFEVARHPSICQTYQGGEFIPNDATLGPVSNDGAPRMLILSGPNMGGKSTLLRQTCLVAVMAQVGCYVPASSAELTPVDRIFTRVGASDKILSGMSTFFVELSETATILHHATPHSLVILDELGRGTSTFDGTAIAHAVVSYLVKKSKCLSMFATHYHSVVEEWGSHPEVFSGHMDCLVEGDDLDQRVTFLYKLADGPCPKSFGINVARLAQLPHEVLVAAKRKSEEFEAALMSSTATSQEDDAKAALALRLLELLDATEDDPTQASKLIDLWNEAQAL